MNQTQCYYATSTGETRGPTTLLALKALLKVKAPDVTEDTLVFVDGSNEWTPLKQILKTNNNDSESLTTQSKDTKSLISKKTSSVYVQGLPKDVTTEEVLAYFSKCGLIKKDLHGSRIKIYRDPETNEVKGDALVTYVMSESVSLAIQQLDDSDLRNGCKIQVQEAHFDVEANEGSSTNQPKSKHRAKTPVDKKEQAAKRARKLQEKAMLSWNEDSYRTKEAALLIVVLKHMFDPQKLEADGEATIRILENDLVEGLDEICPEGDEIKKVTIFKSHPEGVVVIRFKDASVALKCVELMNGRFYDGRKLSAELWDGVTEYAPKGDAELRVNDEVRRMEAFDEWLEHDEDDEDAHDDRV